jgi:phosphorylated adapter RNA export protein
MMKFQQKRKVNNIWGDLLMEEQEQQALEKFGSIDVDGKQVLIERGPESYTFKPGTTGQLGKRKRHLKVGRKGPKRNDDDSDVSSTALSDDDLSYIRRKKESSGVAAGGSRGKIKSGFSETGELLVSEVRDRLGKIKGRKLAYLIARELEEPKTQLIVRAVEILGKYYCIDLFIKTLKIEKRGGLLVKTQTRRRTPGGIFFYMLRKDDRYPPEKVQSVFEVDKQIVSREKRNIRAAKRKEQKAKVERLQHRVDKMKGTKPMDEEKKDCDDIAEEDGELPSYEGSSASDSDSDDSEIDDDDDLDQSNQNPDLANEASNDYLDIHCGIDEFTDL